MEDKEKIMNAIEIYNKGEQLEGKDKYEEAFKAYEEAVKLNYNKALFKVGHFYRFGLGVDKDLIKAMYYWKRSFWNMSTKSLISIRSLIKLLYRSSEMLISLLKESIMMKTKI